jgi:hypothetical protein
MGLKYLMWPYRLALRYKGSVSHKMRYLTSAKLAKKNGVAFSRIDRVAAELTESFYSVKDMTEEEKIWYIKKGYNPNRKAWFGMNKENYKEYLSLFDFYNRKNYTYGDLTNLFDNKLMTFFSLQPFKESMPFHYFYIRKGKVLPLQVKEKQNYCSEDIISIIEQRPIVFKRCHGGHGVGFMMVENLRGEFYLNRNRLSREALGALINNLDDYLVTDYIVPSENIQKVIGEGAYAVMRVLTCYDGEDGPQVIGVIVRLGTKKAGLTQAGHDCIYVGVDMETGRFFNPVYETSDYEFHHLSVHPDTSEPIEGKIADIKTMENLVKKISGHFPMTPYLCFDIIPSDAGFFILEINSHGQPFIVEPYYNVKNNKYFKKIIVSNH